MCRSVRSLRRYLAIGSGCIGLITAVVIIWLTLIQPVREHTNWYKRVHGDIYSLAAKRPPDVPPGEWEFAVGWTINLHANCASDYASMSHTDRDSFARELSRRLLGSVDLTIIDWIWDEYARSTKRGRTYSIEYRPTAANRLKDAEVGCFGIPVQ